LHRRIKVEKSLVPPCKWCCFPPNRPSSHPPILPLAPRPNSHTGVWALGFSPHLHLPHEVIPRSSLGVGAGLDSVDSARLVDLVHSG
jgi:hypothetical protein